MNLIRALHEAGIMGMNRRNFDYVQRWNRRYDYPLVDDKVRTKEICAEAGIPIPGTLAVIRRHFEIRRLRELLLDSNDFVVKPAHGAQGNGIMVLERHGDGLMRSGTAISYEDLGYHVAEILSGLFSLAGQTDHALIEERLHVHEKLASVSFAGVPDIRLLVYRGVPIMAMARLPTRRSRGRANLHQGAMGVGIDLSTGRSVAAIVSNRYLDRHPDTAEPVVDLEIPEFPRLLECGVRAADCIRMGYIGVDLVVDRDRGPVLLELNARPGLSIQVANRAGLLARTQWVDRFEPERRDASERIEAARAIAAECRSAA